MAPMTRPSGSERTARRSSTSSSATASTPALTKSSCAPATGCPPRPECDDGILFRGRGFIQLTGRYNYEQMQKEIAGKVPVDIAKNPDDAGRPGVAAKILAAYLANRKAEIEGHMSARRFSDARKVVNKAALGLPEFEAFVAAAEKALP
jgi:predicted chitinase